MKPASNTLNFAINKQLTSSLSNQHQQVLLPPSLRSILFTRLPATMGSLLHSKVPTSADDMKNPNGGDEKHHPVSSMPYSSSTESNHLVSDTCKKTTAWSVDSGASRHCTRDSSLFTSYTSKDSPESTVRLADGRHVQVVGEGDVCFTTSTGMDLILKDVLHVPDLQGSLLSVAALDEQGYSSFFSQGKWILTRGLLVVARAEKVRNRYIIEGTPSRDRDDRFSDLWDKRLNHLKLSGVQNLAEERLLPGLQASTTSHCLYCPYGGGNHRQPACRQSDLLALVHIDLYRPFKQKSLTGSLCFVTFVDDCSRKIWCYALESKSQVQKAFKEFRSSAELTTGRKLKCVYSERGREFSNSFREYCRRHDIQYFSTRPGTPSLNDLAEAMNKSLMERVASLLANAKLPWAYWDMALSAAVHVKNLCLTDALDNDVPDRIWFGQADASYDHLRVFGCKALVGVTTKGESCAQADDDQCKTTQECIFVGYNENGREVGYKFYDPIKKQVIYSRAAEFLEDQNICDITRGQQKEPTVAANPETKKKWGVLKYLMNKFIHTDSSVAATY